MIARQALRGWLAMLVNIGVQLGKVSVYYHHLGEFTDAWFLLVSFMGFLILFEGGVTFTAMRFLGRAMGHSSIDFAFLIEKLKRQFWGWSSAYVALAGMVSYFYVTTLPVAEEIKQTMLMGAWLLVAGSAIGIAQGIYSALLAAAGKTGTNSIAETFGGVFAFALSWFFLLSGLGFLGVALGESLRSVVSVLVKRFVCFRDEVLVVILRKRRRFSRGCDAPGHQILLKSQLVTAIANGGMLLFVAWDSVFLGQIFGVSNAANYLNMQNAVALSSTAVGTVTTAVLPHMLRSVQTDPQSMIRMMYGNLIFVLVAFSLFGGVLIFFGKYFFEFWLGPANYIGLTFLFLFLIYYLSEAVAGVLLNGLYSKEYLGYWRIFWICALVRFPLGLILMANWDFDLYAVIVSRLGTYSLIVISFAMWKYSKVLGVNNVWVNVTSMVLPFVCLISVAFMTMHFFEGMPLYSLIILIVVYLTLMAIVGYLLVQRFGFDLKRIASFS